MTGVSGAITVIPQGSTTTTSPLAVLQAPLSNLELEVSIGRDEGRTVTAQLSCSGGVSCSKNVEITVARKHHRGGEIFYTHPVLAEAAVTLEAGSHSSVDLTVTKAGRSILERRKFFHHFRTTMLLQGSTGRDVTRFYLPR